MSTTKFKTWTVAEYHQMIEAGILSPLDQVELLEVDYSRR